MSYILYPVKCGSPLTYYNEFGRLGDLVGSITKGNPWFIVGEVPKMMNCKWFDGSHPKCSPKIEIIINDESEKNISDSTVEGAWTKVKLDNQMTLDDWIAENLYLLSSIRCNQYSMALNHETGKIVKVDRPRVTPACAFHLPDGSCNISADYWAVYHRFSLCCYNNDICDICITTKGDISVIKVI